MPRSRSTDGDAGEVHTVDSRRRDSARVEDQRDLAVEVRETRSASSDEPAPEMFRVVTPGGCPCRDHRSDGGWLGHGTATVSAPTASTMVRGPGQ